MNTALTEMFDDVRQATHEAKLIAWDGCHKIYLLMDETEANYMRSHGGYECVVDTPTEMFVKLMAWWDNSCALRFISSVETVGGESVFTQLVPQGAEDGDPFDDEPSDDENVENFYGSDA